MASKYTSDGVLVISWPESTGSPLSRFATNDSVASFPSLPSSKPLRTFTGLSGVSDSSLEENILKAPSPPAFTWPEGGSKAWATVIGSWLVSFCTFGFVTTFGVFQDFYVRQFLPSSSPSTISWIGSTQLFLQFSLGLLVGKAFDEGYFHQVMLMGSMLYVVALFALSCVERDQFYQVFLSQGLVAGLGLGAMFLPSLSVVSHHFNKRRSLAMGVVVSGSSIGGILFPIMLNKLFATVGFAWGVRISALIILVLLVIANFLMTTRIPPRSKRPPGPPVNFGAILRDVPYILAIAGGFLTMLGLFMPIFYLQLFSIAKGINPGLAFYLVAIMNGSSVVGRVLPNFLADTLGTFNMLIPMGLLTSILIFVMLSLSNVAGVILFAVFYGFASGAFISLFSPMLSSLASHVGEIGLRMGFAFTCVGFAALFGNPINGALLTSSYIWWRPALFSGLSTVVGALLLSVSRQIIVNRKGSWKV